VTPAIVQGTQRRMRFVFDHSQFRLKPNDKHVRRSGPGLQQGTRPDQSSGVVGFLVLAHAHDELSRQAHDQ
jgi:hypothetical protein